MLDTFFESISWPMEPPPAYGAFHILFTLIGLPLLSLDEKNAGMLILPLLGTMLISIGAMAVYSVGIEAKYRKKK